MGEPRRPQFERVVHAVAEFLDVPGLVVIAWGDDPGVLLRMLRLRRQQVDLERLAAGAGAGDARG